MAAHLEPEVIIILVSLLIMVFVIGGGVLWWIASEMRDLRQRRERLGPTMYERLYYDDGRPR